MLLTVAQESWQYEGTVANQSPRNLEWRGQKLARFVAWAETQGVREVESVTVPLVHRFLSDLPPTLSDFTRNGYARVLRAFLYYCVREELIPERLPKRLIMPKVPIKVIDVFTAEQIKRLMGATVHEASPSLVQRDRAILAVLFDCGLRASELCSLTLDNVHFSPDDSYLTVMGKGRRERQVGLGNQARLELHRWIHRHRTAPLSEPRVIVNRSGHPMTRWGIDQMIYRCRNYAGAQHYAGVRVSAHTCRHTFAVNYLSQTGDVYRLSRLLGHASVSVTEEYLKAFTSRQARQGKVSVLDSL